MRKNPSRLNTQQASDTESRMRGRERENVQNGPLN